MESTNYTPTDGFPYYFELAKGKDLHALFSSLTAFDLLNSIDEEKADYRYEPDKWSIKQVVGHMADHERIKMFRAFQLSRNEQVQLWGYDQNRLVANSRFEELRLCQLIEDFKNVRETSISFINMLSVKQLMTKGPARQYEITLRDFLVSISADPVPARRFDLHYYYIGRN
jgi:hypothetical protein